MTQEEFLQDLEAFLREWHNDEPTVWVHTSGSTGTPKPLQVEKERMMASARLTCSFLGLKEGDTTLLCMPLQYIAGKMVVVRSLVAGLKLIPIAPTGHPLKDIDEPPTFAAMIPMQVYNTLQVPEERKKLMNRLSRMEGQIRGIRGMIEKDAYCADILVQSAAVSAAVNAFNKELLASHIHTCVADGIRAGDTEVVDELVRTVEKLMK